VGNGRDTALTGEAEVTAAFDFTPGKRGSSTAGGGECAGWEQRGRSCLAREGEKGGKKRGERQQSDTLLNGTVEVGDGRRGVATQWQAMGAGALVATVHDSRATLGRQRPRSCRNGWAQPTWRVSRGGRGGPAGWWGPVAVKRRGRGEEHGHVARHGGRRSGSGPKKYWNFLFIQIIFK
jgi:hypothetical protein